MADKVRSIGLYINAALVTGGRAIVTPYTDGTIRYQVGGAIAPVALNEPVTTRARAVNAAARNGNVTFALTQRVLSAAVEKRSDTGKFDSVIDMVMKADWITLSKHDRKAVVAAMKARYEA